MARNRHGKMICYMCDQTSTSKEHFPPKCFFPDNYRDNLCSVPSCKDHNSDKSKDDEYLLLMIYSHSENDLQMQNLMANWAGRAVLHNPNLRNLFVNPRPVLDDRYIKFDVDRERINNEIEHIARAAYYHEYHEKWPYQIGVLCIGLLSDSTTDGMKAIITNKMTSRLGNATGEFLQNQPRKGSNQKIFYYQINRDINQKNLLIRMVFYEGFVAVAYSSPVTTKNS